MKEIAGKLKEKKIKVTPQRIAVFQYLVNNRHHPTADTIYHSIEKDHPNISLATIYKTLETLKNSGLIDEINVGDGISRYDAFTQAHFHFICNKCNTIYDLTDTEPIIDEIKKTISDKSNFKIDSTQFYLYGDCQQC